MKTMKHFLLTAAAVAAVALCATAQTTIKAMACEDIVLTATPATGTGTMTYSWYSGPTAAACTTAVAGCGNSETCAIPAASAINTVVYKRTVVSSECPAEVQQITITVQYQGLKVGTVCWAPVNVGNTGSWTEKPDNAGGMFQFNRTQAWHATKPGADVAVPGWPSNPNGSTNWDEATNPVCPTGWRLPTSSEFQALHNASTTGSASGAGTWVAANAKGNALAGKFYGSNHTTCSLVAGSSMNGCIFLPAAGNRGSTTTDGALVSRGRFGNYWSSTQQTASNGYHLTFNNESNTPANDHGKTYGYTVRCVKTV